jgi:hypothetical protein
MKVIPAAITGILHLTTAGSGHQYRAMRVFLVFAAWLGLWLAASPAIAQMSEGSDVRAGDKATDGARSAAVPSPPTPSTPTASPDEIAHQAMVEEQERRDRAEQAERDRDDQG